MECLKEWKTVGGNQGFNGEKSFSCKEKGQSLMIIVDDIKACIDTQRKKNFFGIQNSRPSKNSPLRIL